MAEIETVVGSAEGEENTLTIAGIDRVKTGTVQDNGRIYLARNLAGEFVKYAVIREGTVASLGSAEVGKVTLNDVDVLDHGKVLSNGHLFVGSWYAGEEISLAVKVVDESEVPKNRPENRDTAETED